MVVGAVIWFYKKEDRSVWGDRLTDLVLGYTSQQGHAVWDTMVMMNSLGLLVLCSIAVCISGQNVGKVYVELPTNCLRI